MGASDTIMDPMFNVNQLGSHDMGLIKLATPVTTVAPSPVNLVAANAPIDRSSCFRWVALGIAAWISG